MWPLGIKFSFTEKVYSVRIVLIAFIFSVAVSVFLAFKLGFLVLVLLLVLVLVSQGILKGNYKVWITGLILLGFFGGNLIGGRTFNQFKIQNYLLKSLTNKQTTIQGKVVTLESAQKGIFVTLRLGAVNNKIWPYPRTNICFYTNDSNKLNLGSTLKIKGNFTTGERVSLQCLGYLTNPSLLEIELGPQHSFSNLLMRFRQSLHKTLSHNIREPFLSLAQGYILGDDKTTDSEIKDILERTSMTHIVAVSGFNIAILFLLLKRIFLFFHFSPHFAYGLSLIFNIIFITIAGSPASAIRAGIMLSLILGAERLERMGNFLNVLLLTAFVMILVNPLIVIYDMGFQLSFLASLGLLCKQIIKPKVETISVDRLGNVKSAVSETFWDSVLVILLVSPILIWNGGILSLKPLLANLPVLPLVPLATFLVITLLFISPLIPSLAYLLGFFVETIIRLQLMVLKFVASLNFLSFRLPVISFTWIVFYYLLLVYFIHLQLRKNGNII